MSKGNSKRRKSGNKSFWIVLIVFVILLGIDFGINGSQGTLVQGVKEYVMDYLGIQEEVVEAQVIPEPEQEVLNDVEFEQEITIDSGLEKTESEKSEPERGTPVYTSNKLDVYFYDVGQADCILLLIGGQALLVDSGNAGDAALDDKIKDKINVTHELKRLGVEELDVVGTHVHEDHIGSTYKICDAFEIKNLYMPSLMSEEEQPRYYQRLMDVIQEKDIHLVAPTTLSEKEIKEEIKAYNDELMSEYEEQVKNLKANGASSEEIEAIEKPELMEYHTDDYIWVGDTIPFGNAKVTMLAPNSAEYSDTNDYSIVLMVEFEGVKLLLTGDAGKESEDEMLEFAKNNNFDLNCDILKVSHHGSRTANTEAFIEAVAPEYAVVMVEEGNSYGLPDEDVLERLENHGSVIYQTKDMGDIHLIIDDGSFEFDFDFSHEVK